MSQNLFSDRAGIAPSARWAKLYCAADDELEQIQLLLGHASVQTTACYVGPRQNLTEAVNDKLRLGQG